MSIKHIAKQYIKMFVQGAYLPGVYDRAAADSIDPKKIIFADAHNHSAPYSMRRLEAACRSAGFNVETHYSDYQKDGFSSTYKNMQNFMKSYATAKAVVISDTFLPVASCKKRPETKVVQLWHGAGALKKFGYSTTDDVPAYYRGNIYGNYDLITVSGHAAVEPFATSMRANPGVARDIGISRTDNYFDEAYMEDMRKRVWDAYPDAKNKKVALFAPTFRGSAEAAGEDEIFDTVKNLHAGLSDDWYLIVSAHPHARNAKSVLNEPGVARTAEGFCTEEIMLIADVLITDYSSIIFDYLFLKRPVILFAPDYEAYDRKRGFFTPFEKLPGRIVTDEAALADAIDAECSGYDSARAEAYIAEYLEACDGHATDRILEYLKM